MVRRHELTLDRYKKLRSILDNRPIISRRTPVGGLIFHLICYYYGPNA